MKTGVVIGSYGMPGVVELNIAAIRASCGPSVPILISDDCTPCSEGRERLGGLPDRWPGVYFTSTLRNIGHARGDCVAFYNGLRWANTLGLDVLVKFSQRFILTAKDWIHRDAQWLKSEGHAVASQPGYHLHMFFPMRTEAVMMNVPASMPVVAAMENNCVTAAEQHIHFAYSQNGLAMGRWPRIPPDRFHRYAGIVWHNSDADDTYNKHGKAYVDLAAKLGVDLGPEFSSAGWHVIAAHRPQCEYAHFK